MKANDFFRSGEIGGESWRLEKHAFEGGQGEGDCCGVLRYEPTTHISGSFQQTTADFKGDGKFTSSTSEFDAHLTSQQWEISSVPKNLLRISDADESCFRYTGNLILTKL